MWFIGSEATSIDLIADQYQSVMKTIAHICLSIGLLMAWGCTEESLDYRKQEGYVQIALSWDEGFSPAGSRFYFYPENGGEMLSFDCPSEGFGGVLPVGRYRVIVVNSDCVNVAVRNERSYDTAEIYVLPDEDGEHVCQPERLAYATRLVESETLEVPYRDTVRVAAAPCSCIKHVRFMLEIGDFVPLSSCRGSFSGVSLSRHCLSGLCSSAAASVRFTADPVAGSSSFTADIYVLDLVPPRTDAPSHLLSLELVGEDGSTIYPVTADLTDAVRSIASEGGVFPNEISLRVVLSLIDGQLRASVLPWDEGSGGGVI